MGGHHGVGIPSGTILRLEPFESDDDAVDIEVGSTRIVDVGASAYILVGKIASREGSVAVALKVFPAMLSEDNQVLLKRELKACRQIQHDLILPFLGTTTFGLHTIIVSHYMFNGNLHDYVNNHPDANRRRLVLQVAQAVSFLHNESGHVHGDLKGHNVLVSNDGNALLADFGLSTTIQKAESEATTATGIRQRNSLRFTAPELLLEEPDNTEPEGDDPLSPGAQIIEIRVPQPGTSELLLEQSVSKEHGGSNHSSPGRKRRRSKTPASDVYAFGMLVLEVFTGALPWQNYNEASVIFRVSTAEIPRKPSFLWGFDADHWELCVHCWSFYPEQRPAMSFVVDRLLAAGDPSASYGDKNMLPPAVAADREPKGESLRSRVMQKPARPTILATQAQNTVARNDSMTPFTPATPRTGIWSSKGRSPLISPVTDVSQRSSSWPPSNLLEVKRLEEILSRIQRPPSE